MYADVMTDSMRNAIEETNRRREIQEAYNKEHGITPTTIKKAVRDLIAVSKAVAETEVKLKKDPESMSKKELKDLISQLEKQMRQAPADLNFEQAAELLKLNAATVRRYCCTGRIRKACRVGRSYRIPAEALELFMELNPKPSDNVPA